MPPPKRGSGGGADLGLEAGGTEEYDEVEEEADNPRRKVARYSPFTPPPRPEEYLERSVTKVIDGTPCNGRVVKYRGDLQPLFMIEYDHSDFRYALFNFYSIPI